MFKTLCSYFKHNSGDRDMVIRRLSSLTHLPACLSASAYTMTDGETRRIEAIKVDVEVNFAILVAYDIDNKFYK